MSQGLNSGTSPNTVIKARLDEVMYGKYEREEQPDELMATNSTFFKQRNIDNRALVYEEFSGVGDFDETVESETRPHTTVSTDNTTTRIVRNFKKTVAVPKEYFDDDQHDMVNKKVEDLGRKGRLTMDKRSVQDTYGDAFTGAINTTPDGETLASNAHVTLSGDIVDNLETGVLNPDNLETLVNSLREQKGQDGEIASYVFDGLLVPTALYADALEVMQSVQKANTDQNNLNYFYTKYGTVAIKSSVFLENDTAYHVVSDEHSVTRNVREAMSTTLVGWEYDDEDRYMYKAGYREMYYPGSWMGYAGSNGTV